MTPEQVRAAVGQPFESFQRHDEGEFPCDYFPDVALFSYYTEDGEAEAFEFAGDAEVLFKGKNLLKLGMKEILALLGSLDPELDEDEEGFTSELLGIGGYAPGWEEDPSSPPEGIIVFAEGYYDDGEQEDEN